jgi:hypothetical protein
VIFQLSKTASKLRFQPTSEVWVTKKARIQFILSRQFST